MATTAFPTAPIERLHLRALLVVSLVGLAYHYSFLTLSRGLTLLTPLAFIALVPIMAVGLAWVTVHVARPTRTIDDRQVDYLVGIGLVGGAAMIAIVSPMSLGATFWVYRVDLLSLPLFAAGLVSIFFGVRRAWVLRGPLAFLLLAWPVPYIPVLAASTRASVELTVALLTQLTSLTPWVQPIAAVSSDTFAVQHDGDSFLVSVTAACSGINSMIGFGLVGLALVTVLRGPLSRRLAWLLAGLVFVFVVNGIRIEAIFAVGAVMGPEAALQMLHPVAGLIAFNIVLIAMLLLAPRFGLALRKPADELASPSRSPGSHVTGIRGAAIVGLTLAAGFAAVNAAYERFDPSEGGSGAPSSMPQVREPRLEGWGAMPIDNFATNNNLFGPGSTWDRVRYTSDPSARFRSEGPLYIDVIGTSEGGLLGAYGIQGTYPFIGYELVARTTAEVAADLQAELVSYRHPLTGRDWSLASWVAATSTDDGMSRFERITLLFPDSLTASVSGTFPPDVQVSGDEYGRVERFLVAIARDIEDGRLVANP